MSGFKKLIKNPIALVAIIIIAIYVFAAIFAPLISPYAYDEIDLANRLAPFSWSHIFGTDELGRDVLTRLIYGARISLIIGIFSTFISAAIGILLGVVAGYYRGKVETIIMRIVDIILSFPTILLTMVIIFSMGNSISHMLLAIALVDWAGTARLIYSRTITVKESGYVDAAKGIGVKNIFIILKHIIPNCFGQIIAIITMGIPAAIISESTLSFLGLGITIPNASWGTMIDASKQFLYVKPALCIVPCIVIFVLVLAFNLLGKSIDKITKE